MKSLFESLNLKLMVTCIALLVVGLVIWFIGPLMSFDTLRPLASVNMRVTVIVLLLALTIFAFTANGLWSSLGMALIGVVALGVLVWHASPLLKFGNAVPFADETSRLLLICLITLAYLIWVALQIRKAMTTDPIFADQVLNRGAKEPLKEAEKQAQENLKEVKGIVSQAVGQLKRMRTSATGLMRLFEGKRYLYELPWYMIIGNPGAGKTTALMNSGLKFVLPQQLSQTASRGKNMTDKCDWWFTNEAVLIDTAGRYANHAEGGAGVASNDTEWKGFLHLLRQQRPRAPINGAIVTINVADLLNRSVPERATLAADLRARLEELRENLGIRFPVYVMLSKMDLMPGFEAYFSTLTSEARNQVWGFTLPYETGATGLGKTELRSLCTTELEALSKRLDAGVNTRLQEEFDTGRRQRLALLPQEFEALIKPLSQVIEDIFLVSRYDSTQLFSTLRGVYFTSGAQAADMLIVDQHSLWQRVRKALTGKSAESENANAARTPSTGNRSYFLHDLLTRLVFAEAHLVRPNVRWELRFRVLRLLGHTLVGVIFTWLFLGVLVSAGNNEDYLQTVHAKAQALHKSLQAYYAKPSYLQVPLVLDAGLDLPTHPHLDALSPNTSWRYGLYTAPELVSESMNTYASLEDRLLLPFLVRRMESVLEDAIENNDAELTYATLRVYLFMHEKDQFKASDVKKWLLEDWENSDSADAFGNHPNMVRHIQQLFNGSRVIQSPFIRNDDLILRARKFLDGKPSIDRVYERIKSTMSPKAPEPFTLISALGPQSAGSFTRASEAPLDQGISGLFTYAGYHELFKKQLPDYLRIAYEDDNWVMGRRDTSIKNASALAQLYDPDGKLATDIRRLYFNEYAQRWNEFLDDLHAPYGATRAFSLQTMRLFAAPDSPLVRLAKAVVKETTLSRSIDSPEKSLLEKASDVVDQKAQDLASQVSGARAQARLERQLVDNRFAALREIMTGEANSEAADAGKSAKGSLDTMNGLINTYYAQLVVADNALSAQSNPPPNNAGNNLRLEAAKMPSPFRNVLTDLVIEGMRSVNIGIGEVLITQTESTIGEFCRRAINGKYPFANTDQEVDADDFARLFAAGGMIDDFFQKVLAPYVDSNVTPWRYKQDTSDMPPVAGPSLSSFAQAIRIRDTFFRDPSAKKMTWKADIRVVEIDPAITDLMINLDGQTLRYAHGPVIPWNIVWPGPRGGSVAEMSANPRIRSDGSTIAMRGPWAVFRLFERGQISSTSSNSKTIVDFKFDGRPATVEINAGTQPNPLTSDVLKGFKCPGRRA